MRKIVVDGKHLEVIVHEPPTAVDPPIVLLHEGLGSVAMWKTFPAQLAQQTVRRVIVYSRYGHGESDVLDSRRDVNYMHHEGKVVLPRLIDQLGIDRPILAGHSDGASIALICAGAHPDLPSALVLEAPHVFVEDRTIAGIEAARAAYNQTELPQRLRRYHRDVDSTFWAWSDIWLDPRFRSWNIESYLTTIRCPALVIQGERDEYGTVAQLDAITANVAETQIVLLADCGHSPHRDRPQATLAAIDGFLNDFVRQPRERTHAP